MKKVEPKLKIQPSCKKKRVYCLQIKIELLWKTEHPHNIRPYQEKNENDVKREGLSLRQQSKHMQNVSDLGSFRNYPNSIQTNSGNWGNSHYGSFKEWEWSGNWMGIIFMLDFELIFNSIPQFRGHSGIGSYPLIHTQGIGIELWFLNDPPIISPTLELDLWVSNMF